MSNLPSVSGPLSTIGAAAESSGPVAARNPGPASTPHSTDDRFAALAPRSTHTETHVALRRPIGRRFASVESPVLTRIVSKGGWLPPDVYDNPDFVSRSVLDFAASQLQIPRENVVDALFNALPEGKKTEANRLSLESAATRTVNASGAVMMMVHTDSGLHLVAANSQRRKLVIQTNGACEKGESIRHTAKREFLEELANPNPGGILLEALDDGNLRAINGSNRIGQSAEEIANRIVEKKATFLNVTGLYVNRKPVTLEDLRQEVSTLNEKLGRTQPFYQPAVDLLYGDRGRNLSAADLTQEPARSEAAALIRNFGSRCSDVITADLKQYFDQPAADDVHTLKKGLEAIIDLSENDRIELIDEQGLASAMRMFEADRGAAKLQYFGPAFESIFLHKGPHTPEQFLELLRSDSRVTVIGAPIGDLAAPQ